jgi:hypothetical protein
MSMGDRQQSRKLQFSIRTLLYLTTVVGIALAGVMAIYQFRERQVAKYAAEAERNQLILLHAAKDVEAICANLQRAPNDEKELEMLLGNPLPTLNDRGAELRMFYYRTGETCFQLVVARWYTDLVYDSKTPTAGWTERDW